MSSNIYGYFSSKFDLKYTLEETIFGHAKQFWKDNQDLLEDLITKNTIKHDLFIIFMNDHQFRPKEIDITNKGVVKYIRTIIIRNYVNYLPKMRYGEKVNYFEFLDYLKNTNWYKKTFIKNKKKQTKLQ